MQTATQYRRFERAIYTGPADGPFTGQRCNATVEIDGEHMPGIYRISAVCAYNALALPRLARVSDLRPA